MSKTNTVYNVYQPSEVATNPLQGTLEYGTPCHSLHTETKLKKQTNKPNNEQGTVNMGR